jgi:hypothetical protein
MRYTFPSDYAERSCYVVAINASLIPLVAGALKHFLERRSWHDDAEYELGYNAFADLQRCMMKCCIDDLLASNDRLYRMVDTALYGTEYTIEATDPELIVTPEISATHDLTIEHADSILGRMEDMRQLLQNGLNGTETPNYDRANGVRDLLEQLITAAEAESELDPEMLAKLAEIAVLLA